MAEVSPNRHEWCGHVIETTFTVPLPYVELDPILVGIDDPIRGRNGYQRV